MAIKIPSSNIYEIKHSPIRNNIIDNVEIGEKKCQLVTDYHTIVNNSTYSATTVDKGDISTDKDCQFPNVTGDNYYIAVQYAQLQCGYLTDISITIHKSQSLKRVINIYDKTNKDGYNNIGYTVNYTRTEYNVSANATLYIKTSDKSVDITNMSITKGDDTNSDNGSGEISSDNPITYKEETPPIYIGEDLFGRKKYVTLSTTCSVDNLSTIPTAEIIDNGDEYQVTLKVLTYLNQYYVRYGKLYNYLDWQNDQTLNVTMNGKGVVYNPKSVDITIYGDTINLDIEDIVEKINNKDNRYSIDANELIQTTNIVSPKNSYNDLIDNYKDGKETAVIRCSISDYKDDSGVKVIDITTADKMCFEIGDEVIPMVYTANGVDMPMSTDRTGNAKVFIVIGKKPYYDGAVWQELTLQEKTN